jgi:hypothetical protein
VPTIDLAHYAQLVEQPFTSNVPLLGPLIARFRTAWNNVAARWYVGQLTAQQNAYNALLAQQLALYERQLRQQALLLRELAAAAAQQEQELAELREVSGRLDEQRD